MSDVGSYPIIARNGGTGFVNNNASTINLSSPVTGYVLTSDSVGACTLQPVSGSGAVVTLTGDSGSATATAGVINVYGNTAPASTGLTFTGSGNVLSLGGTLVLANGGTNASLTASDGGIFYSTASAGAILAGTATATQMLQSGSSTTPAWSTSTWPATTTINQILYSSSANTVAGIATANNSVLITGTTGIPSILAAGTTGQILTATTGSPPSWQNPATSGTVTSVSVVSANGFAGTVATATTTPAITLSTTITGLLSGNGTAISGSAITQYDVLVGGASNAVSSVGPGSAGQVLQSSGNAANPAYSTATYPSTTTINQILYSSSANVVAGLATANNGVLTTGTSGIPVITALASDGQLIIGSGSGAPAAAVLTPGTGITITNAANSITIAQTNPSGFPWTDVTGATQTLAVNNGYITDHTNVTYTLPASAALGDTMIIVGKLGITTIAQNANQQIDISSASSTVGVGGSVAGTNVGDCITLVCITSGANTVWRADSFVGNWTLS